MNCPFCNSPERNPGCGYCAAEAPRDTIIRSHDPLVRALERMTPEEFALLMIALKRKKGGDRP